MNFCVRYLSNSGFLLDLEDVLIVFDDECTVPGLYDEKVFEGKRAVVFFASHSHGDHFSPDIFRFADDPRVHYVLSYDIAADHDKACHLTPGESCTLEGVTFIATGSTDLGISVTVEYEGHRFFHAGDLNDWHWKEEGDPAYTAAMGRTFRQILSTIRAPFDLAFFPVDSRLGRDCDQGADAFLEEFSPKRLIPMHFRDRIPAVQSFAAKHAHSPTQIITLTQSGEEYGGIL